MSAASITANKGHARLIASPLAWVRRHLAALGLIAVLIAFMFPLFWVLGHSFEPLSEWERGGVTLWPSHFTLHNYRQAIKLGFLRNVLASVVVASITTVITLVISSLAGYAIARLPIRGRGWVLAFVILAGFFPVLAMIGPLYLMFRNLGLLNTWTGVALADLIYTLPLCTWLLASLFSQMPVEVEEAAMVDGCGRLAAMWRVVLPLAAPAMVTAAIISFILAWSDFAFSVSFLLDPHQYTAPRAILYLGSAKFFTDYNLIDATVMITALPILLLVLVAQRRIVTGLTAGAVK